MVYDMWDARNRRYWLCADVMLEDGTFLRDVVFDGESRVAVQIAGRDLDEFPGCFGKRITDFFTVEDFSPGREPPFRADEQRRAAFATRHGGGVTPARTGHAPSAEAGRG